MAHLFLSYSRRDKAWLTSLTRFLQDVGTSHFVDIDPETGIPAGRFWERELYRQLRRSDAVLALVSEAQRDSKWCFAELAIARSLGKTIFPLRLDGGGDHPLLADIHHTSIAVLDSDAGRERLLSEIRRSAPDGQHTSFAFDPARPPYPGLEPYSEADAAVFFGRETESREILDALSSSTITSADHQVLTLTGPSGSGKSSLVRAGILPRLRRDETHWPVVAHVVPGDEPERALARSLSPAMPGGPGLGELAEQLKRDADAFRAAASALLPQGGASPGRALFFFDQFEELYTVCEEPARRAFFESLRRASGRGARFFLLIAIRSEFLDRLIADAAWLCQPTKVALPLDRERLPAVIEGPAKIVGMEFAPGLVERMVADTQGGDALPMLNFTLNQLHKMVGSDRLCDHQDYERLGGVVGALRRQADAVQASLEQRGLGRFVEPTLLRLADVDHKGEPVRRRLRQVGLDRQEREVATAFVNARLLKTDGDGKDATVEVAHEALLRQWPPLRRAIERSQDRMATLARLYQLADHWEASGGHPSYLQVGPMLQRFLELVRGTSPPALVSAYLDASIAFAAPPFWRRAVAFVSDLLLAAVLTVIVFGSTGLDEVIKGRWAWIPIFSLFYLVRAIGFRYGGTPGMRLTGLALASRTGDELSWRKTALRALLPILPFRDRICGTIVLSKLVG